MGPSEKGFRPRLTGMTSRVSGVPWIDLVHSIHAGFTVSTGIPESHVLLRPNRTIYLMNGKASFRDETWPIPSPSYHPVVNQM